MTTVTGVVFYEGPSEIDGQPIIGIATFNSKNDKTGNLVQTWILRADIHPNQAIDSGEDKSICGSCPLRGIIRPMSERSSPVPIYGGETTNKGRSCYVLVQNAPANIFKSFKAGHYPQLSEQLAFHFEGKGLRYGSYGDPVAIPISYWDNLLKYCTGKSEPGYTHQWKRSKFAKWRDRIMASTHSLAENDRAAKAGWRTFRTIMDVTEIASNEIICPASAEGGYTANCEKCGACNGRRNKNDKRKSIAIVAHGSGGKTNLVAKAIARAA